MFVVSLAHNGATFYLRSTIWVDEFDRANKFDTAEKARLALEKAKKFMKPSLRKYALVTQV